ncbi:MAG: SGNH/GDSL hydrolase family protein [Ignavibacterium sp.]|nr:SGNH/GDSL hydrolase family protein [Ignavibacterium sp.]
MSTLLNHFILLIVLINSVFAFDFAEQPDSLIRYDADTIWFDARHFEIEGKGWNNTKTFYARLPAKAEMLVPEKVWQLSSNTAGLSFRFKTDTKSFKVRWELLNPMLQMNHMPATGVSGIDIYKKEKDGSWFYFATGRPLTFPVNISTFNHPDTAGALTEYLVNLPLYNGVVKVEVGILNGDKILQGDKYSSELKPILFYGTSITQGGCASRPGLVHTAIIQRRLNHPVINLGFSGSGKMEIELAHLIAEVDAAIYILDCVRNMTPELIEQRVEPFIKYLRKTRPATPILLVENSSIKNVFPSPGKEVYRREYQKLLNNGVTGLYFLEGTDLLGTDGEGTVDGIHPNDLGFLRHADAFLAKLQDILIFNKIR